jgi:replication initiation protein RepC
LRVDRTAETFAVLPDGVTVHGQLLAAFKAATPRLGLSAPLVHAVDWLFRFTQPQDWERGGRPIVWPSAGMQQDGLSLSASRVKAISRQLIEDGLITMRDSPNGKRYGRRDGRGRIVEAYELDLSPIAAPCRIRAPGGGGQGGARAAAPAGDDRAQRHHPDPRDGSRVRL